MLLFNKYGDDDGRYVDCTYTITETMNEDKTITVEMVYPREEDFFTQLSDTFYVPSIDTTFCVGSVSTSHSGDNQRRVSVNGVSQFIYTNSKTIKFGELPQENATTGNPIKYTLIQLMDFIFAGTGYTIVYNHSNQTRALTLDGNFGYDNRWSMLTTVVAVFNKQFTINGSTITIADTTGTAAQVNAVFGYNVSDVTRNLSSNDIVTKRRGLGAYINPEDESQGRVTGSYTSVLADLFGELEGTIINDTSLTQQQLNNELASSVDNSLSYNYDITYEELINKGITLSDVAVGRNVRLEDSEAFITTVSRVVKRVIEYDSDDSIISIKLTLGRLSVRDQYLRAQSSMTKSAIEAAGGGVSYKANTNGVNNTGGSSGGASKAQLDALRQDVREIQGNYATREWVLQQIELAIRAALGPIANFIQKWFNGGGG